MYILAEANQNLIFSASSKKKKRNIWKILHINARTLGFSGLGHFCDQILFRRKSEVSLGIHLNTWKYNQLKT